MDISVVIGFKDWGVERLLLSIRSLVNSFEGVHGEVIVSDYGSTMYAEGELRTWVEGAGARYVRTETDGHWSRSRAINAGYSVAQGTVLVATDADMLFSPQSMAEIYKAVVSDPHSAVVLQCRDLPEAYDHERISSEMPDWRELHAVSQIRPRWGMGGMFAAHRDVIGAVGGYDNRMHTYGGEDLDLAVRVRRYGCRIRWIENDAVRMYHIWHEPTIQAVGQSNSGKDAIAANRAILHEDLTFNRNNSSGFLARYRIEWAPKQFTVYRGSVGQDQKITTPYAVFGPSALVLRDDSLMILADQLTTSSRAIVAQAVLVRESSEGRLEVSSDMRVPVLVLDTRLFPLVRPYFTGGTWDIFGAVSVLHRSRIDIALISGAIGVLRENRESRSLVSSIDWALALHHELLPEQTTQADHDELLSALPLDFIAEFRTGVDFSLRLELLERSSNLELLEDAAAGWRWVNRDGGAYIFEAVYLNADSGLIGEIEKLPGSVKVDIEPLTIDAAAGRLEGLREDLVLPLIIENERQARGYDDAIIVAWLADGAHTAGRLDLPTGIIEVRISDRSFKVWMSGLDLSSGDAIAGYHADFPEEVREWEKGIYSPAPLEAMLIQAKRFGDEVVKR